MKDVTISSSSVHSKCLGLRLLIFGVQYIFHDLYARITVIPIYVLVYLQVASLHVQCGFSQGFRPALSGTLTSDRD